jgi:hypothetical protein
MCCSTTNQHHHCHGHSLQWESGPAYCGCGGMGHGQTALRLENYKEHLKAELKSVEDQIADLKKD